MLQWPGYRHYEERKRKRREHRTCLSECGGDNYRGHKSDSDFHGSVGEQD